MRRVVLLMEIISGIMIFDYGFIIRILFNLIGILGLYGKRVLYIEVNYFYWFCFEVWMIYFRFKSFCLKLNLFWI